MSAPTRLPERFRAARRDGELAVLEGLHALKHALRFGGDVLEVWTRDPDRLQTLARRLAADVAGEVLSLARPLDDDAFAALAPSPHPTGVIALARRPVVDAAAALRAPGPEPVVLLERPTHHGNIGAVVRVAAAAGAAGVLVTGPHDPWHPAAIRGGAGLQFALPVASLEPEGLAPVVESTRPAVALDPEGEVVEGPLALPSGAVIVFGSERSGVSPALLERADRILSLPMRAGVSSLNLATAVAVTLYLGRAASSR